MLDVFTCFYQTSRIAVKLKFGECFQVHRKFRANALTKRYFAIFATGKSPFRRDFRASTSIVKKFLNDA